MLHKSSSVRPAILRCLVSGARLFGSLQRCGRIAGGEFNFGQMSGDRCSRPLEAQCDIICERLGVKAPRRIDVTAARARRSQLAEDERAKTAIIEPLHRRKGLGQELLALGSRPVAPSALPASCLARAT